MTRAEALDILEHNWTRLVNADYSDKELGEALNVSINALSAIDDIKAEIDAYLQAEGFGSGYRNDVLQIIDKHMGKESE